MQDGCEVYMDSYMASNESCFILTLIIFKNQLLEVNLTQHRETMALRTMTTTSLFYYVMCEDPTWIKSRWNNIWLKAWSHMLHTTLEGPWPHYMILEVSWDNFWSLLWALTIPWSWLLACVWSGLNLHSCYCIMSDTQEKLWNLGPQHWTSRVLSPCMCTLKGLVYITSKLDLLACLSGEDTQYDKVSGTTKGHVCQ